MLAYYEDFYDRYGGEIFHQGELLGEKRGEKRGLKQGRIQGEKEALLRTAKKMIRQDFTDEQIESITGLPPTEIESLRNETRSN